MNEGRFASLTAGLLVRKGNVKPSPATPPPVVFMSRSNDRIDLRALQDWTPVTPMPKRTEAPVPRMVTPRHTPERADMRSVPQVQSVPAAENIQSLKPRRTAPAGNPPPPVQPAGSRRLMVTVTPTEYETLGLIGVKKNKTRQQLVRNALDEYLALLVEEFAGDCQCIYTGGSCGNSCRPRD